MKKRGGFLKHITILFLGSGINVIIGFFTTPVITRIVDPYAYGQLSFFNMYSNLAYVFILLGYDQALTRYYYEKNTYSKRANLVFHLIKIPLCFWVLISVLILLLKNKISFFENNVFIAFFLCLNIVTLILFRFSTLILRLEMNSAAFSVLNILHKILYVLIIVFFTNKVHGHSYEILVFSTVLAALFPTIIGMILQKEIWNFFNMDKGKFEDIKKVTLYSIPFIFSSVLSWGFQAIDKFSIKYLGSYTDVGIYASANSIVGVVSIIATTFNTIWVPMAMENFTKNPQNKQLYKKANQGVTVVMCFIGLNIILFKDLIVFFLGADFRYAASLLPCLIFYPIMFSISETTVNGINFMEKSKYHIVVTLLSMCVNFVGNIILVPIWGNIGAAISTGFSYIVFWGIRTYISVKLYYVDYNIKCFTLYIILMFIYSIINSIYLNTVFSISGYVILIIMLYLFYKDIIMEGFEIVWRILRRGN